MIFTASWKQDPLQVSVVVESPPALASEKNKSVHEDGKEEGHHTIVVVANSLTSLSLSPCRGEEISLSSIELKYGYIEKCFSCSVQFSSFVFCLGHYLMTSFLTPLLFSFSISPERRNRGALPERRERTNRCPLLLRGLLRRTGYASQRKIEKRGKLPESR